MALLFGYQCHAHYRAVDAGVGRDDKDVPGVDPRDVPQLRDDVRIALEAGSGKRVRRQAAVQHEITEGNLVGRYKAAGSAGNLHRKRLRMAGSKGLNYRTVLERLRH